MKKITNSHEELTFIKVAQVLCASGTDQTDYGLFSKVKNGTTCLEDIAQVLNDLGNRNSQGRLWNKQSLRKVIQRTKRKTTFCKSLVPDWSAFNIPLI